MIQYLEQRAPCIYLPNYDFWYSCISPRLSSDVIIIGIVHSDDPQHYEHVNRLGLYWNGIVAVSREIKEVTEINNPPLRGRLVTIPIGVDYPAVFPKKDFSETSPLKIVYHGVLKQTQKRIFDLVGIISELTKRGVPYELTIIGDGPDRERLVDACRPYSDRHQVRFLGIISHSEIYKILVDQDIYVLTSEYEGLPNALLEAMGNGCVPLVTDLRSGINDLIIDGENGFIIPIGQVNVFADRLTHLFNNPNLRRMMAHNAYVTVVEGGYGLDDMVGSYIDLFSQAMKDAEMCLFERPSGKILPPPFFTWKDYLPPSLRAAGKQLKRSFVTMGS